MISPCLIFNLPKLRKILYVDDQIDILLFAEYALTDIGDYETLMCDSREKALDQIEQFKPDLILLDVMMPELDGPTTLSLIRKFEAFKNTPAIFITAKILSNEVSELLSCDAKVIKVIPKPFDPIKISESIQAIWDSYFSKTDSEEVRD